VWWTVRGHKRGREGGTSEAAKARERLRRVGEGVGSGGLETAGLRGCVRVRVCARQHKAGESQDRRLERARIERVGLEMARLETAEVQKAGLEGRA